MIKKFAIKKFFIFLIIQLLSSNNLTLTTLSAPDAKKIGMLIWENEASQRVDLLTFWSQHEPFPSLGIGHFIWFPQNKPAPYKEQFPLMCGYLKENGIKLPYWLNKAIYTGAPWATRQEFLQDKQKIHDLQILLSSTIDLQTNFIIKQFEQQIPSIIKAAPEIHKSKIIHNVQLMQSCPLGTYALVDYLNFKGSGLVSTEEKMGQAWGLLQVLLDMPENLNSDNVNKAFAISAAKILLRRIENSGPNYGTLRYLHGWMKRISTYANQDILKSILIEESKKLFLIYKFCY